MKSHRVLCVANVLMVAGMVPLLLGIAWIFSAVSYMKQHPGQGAGSDAFLMIAVLLFSYSFAFIVSGAAAIWSAVAQKRHADAVSRPSTIIRRSVYVVLLVPLLWYLAMTLSLV